MPFYTVGIARVCHEANREYCASIMGDHSQVAWDEAPDWQKDSAIKGVTFHLEHLRRGVSPLPSASHESWLAQKRDEGWTYGRVKDAEKKQHPCYVPYEELPLEQRVKDYLFGGIVQALFPAWAGEMPSVMDAIAKVAAVKPDTEPPVQC